MTSTPFSTSSKPSKTSRGSREDAAAGGGAGDEETPRSPSSLKSRGSLLGTQHATGVAMDEVLFDVRQFPFDRAGFERFLAREHADENLGFFVSAQQFRQQVENDRPVVHGRPAELPLDDVPKELLDDPKAWSRRIVGEWVADSAGDKQINISGELRARLVADAASDDPAALPKLAEPENEVVRMMREPFLRWVTRVLETNIDDAERDHRKRFGAGMILVTVALGLVLLYLAVPAGLPRWGLVLVLLPTSATGSHQLVSGAMGV